MQQKLSKAERQFCRMLACGSSVREAVRVCGLERPDGLLERSEVVELIKRAAVHIPERVRGGLERLAFGDVSDAVRLLYLEQPTDGQLEQLDLFNVSEIKRGKNGVEIKFFDRLRALEQLRMVSEQPTSSAEPFYRALSESARLAAGGGEDGV